MSKARAARFDRQTTETQIKGALTIDGRGRYDVRTGIRFFDHMLELFTRHGAFDLTLAATGDLDVDQHHTVEDVGIVLGEAVLTALGEKTGIRRFGDAACPLDEALVRVTVDLSGRPFFVYEVALTQPRIGSFDAELVHDFLLALTNQVGMNLHVDMVRGRNPHHVIEASFKALARAMDYATQIDPRVEGVLSTKGSL